MLIKQALYHFSYFALVILEMGSHKLFALAGLKQQPSRCQLPKYLGMILGTQLKLILV
jgi:hypothetical protein